MATDGTVGVSYFDLRHNDAAAALPTDRGLTSTGRTFLAVFAQPHDIDPATVFAATVRPWRERDTDRKQ